MCRTAGEDKILQFHQMLKMWPIFLLPCCYSHALYSAFMSCNTQRQTGQNSTVRRVMRTRPAQCEADVNCSCKDATDSSRDAGGGRGRRVVWLGCCSLTETGARDATYCNQPRAGSHTARITRSVTASFLLSPPRHSYSL